MAMKTLYISIYTPYHLMVWLRVKGHFFPCTEYKSVALFRSHVPAFRSIRNKLLEEKIFDEIDIINSDLSSIELSNYLLATYTLAPEDVVVVYFPGPLSLSMQLLWGKDHKFVYIYIMQYGTPPQSLCTELINEVLYDYKELVNYENINIPYKVIPDYNISDIQKLNKIFDVDDNFSFGNDADFILLDTFLSQDNLLAYPLELVFRKKLISTIKEYHVLLKPHPYALISMLMSDIPFSMNNDSAPWELLVLNDVRNRKTKAKRVVISPFTSKAQFAQRLFLDDNSIIIMLIDIIKNYANKNKCIISGLSERAKICTQGISDVYFPQSFAEFDRILAQIFKRERSIEFDVELAAIHEQVEIYEELWQGQQQLIPDFYNVTSLMITNNGVSKIVAEQSFFTYPLKQEFNLIFPVPVEYRSGDAVLKWYAVRSLAVEITIHAVEFLSEDKEILSVSHEAEDHKPVDFDPTILLGASSSYVAFIRVKGSWCFIYDLSRNLDIMRVRLLQYSREVEAERAGRVKLERQLAEAHAQLQKVYKKYPKWFIHFICWFIPSKEKRRLMREHYVYNKIEK